MKDESTAMEMTFAKPKALSHTEPICVTAYSLHNNKIRFYPRILRAIQAHG